MRFALEIPDPATIRAGNAIWADLGAGTDLHRIHPGAFGASEFNASADGNARFSPIRTRQGAIIPTIYAGQSFACAVCEIILRSPDTPTGAAGSQPHIVTPSDYAHYRHSHVRLTGGLRLVELGGAGQRALGVERNALLAGPKSTYPRTRAWAEEIHVRVPDAQGLYYTSHQYGPEWAAVVFGDRVGDGILAEVSGRAVTDRACHDGIEALARQLGIDYCEV